MRKLIQMFLQTQNKREHSTKKVLSGKLDERERNKKTPEK